ncbi:hypothetical protein [Massilia sp. LjRoot122]|uniref:hypothetical protein n=1 Tax=Massilia sp. LjRoot122 TaxID=3342257 RepID=UPI003ECDCD80
MSKTVSWNEDVLLGNGQMLQIHRTVTYGPDEWGRSGRGPLKEQTIRFARDGHRVEWKSKDRWPIAYMPDILDFASGMPVLVMPVQGWGPCNKYGFPPEGLVAFAYKQGRWDRIATVDLPKELKVNLLRSTQEIKYGKEYKDKRITPSDKQALERSDWGYTKQGQSLSDASKLYADYEDSCVQMRPPPDKQLEKLRQRNSDAERNASTISALVLSVDTEPESVTSKMFLSQKGVWTGAGYLTGSCKGIVEKIEPLRQWVGDKYGNRSELIGYQLLLQVAPADKKKVQIEDASRAQMQSVVCDQSTIFVVRRQNKENLIIHRFGHNGDLVDAFRVAIPDTAKVVRDPDWGTLWTVIPDGKGSLSMSVADYTYPSTASLGGTIKRKVNYAVHLPAR